ncbi:MAG: hypothetical protein WDO06_04855 [Actinomycetota bacterium]
MRDLNDAAQSRISVSKSAVELFNKKIEDAVPGGIVATAIPENQEQILSAQLLELILTLSKFKVDVTLIHFPLLVHDPQYLFAKLEPILQKISYSDFEKTFQAISKPELVHEFPKGIWASKESSLAELINNNRKLATQLSESRAQTRKQPISRIQRIRSLLRKFR